MCHVPAAGASTLSLCCLAAGFRVLDDDFLPIAFAFASPPNLKGIVQSADAHHVDAMTPTDKGYKFFAFAANRSQKLMQPLLFEARKDSIKPQAMTHGGEEFVYVLSGKMRYRVGSTVHLLKPGDSVYFDSDQEHELEPVSEVVRFLAVFAEAPKPAKKQSRKGRK